MNSTRQRLAWFVVLGSFGICVGLAAAAPIALRTGLQNASRPMAVSLRANQGTVGIQQGDSETEALFAGDGPRELSVDGSVLTNASDTALLLFSTPDESNLLARLQVYGNTNVQLTEASAPRFEASSEQQRIAMTLNSGRVFLTLPGADPRPLQVELRVPQGQVVIAAPGRYSLAASNAETQVAVFQGEAAVENGESAILLVGDQRAVMPATQEIVGPLDTERDLLRNGDFGQQLDEWVELAPNVELSGQPTPIREVNRGLTEPALRFSRVGIGHADIGLRQVVNQDVTDFESLRLLLTIRIGEQSLGVCGQQGSECPLAVRMEFLDADGVNRVWQQGFYANGDIGPATPDVCVACPPPLNGHVRVPFQQIVFYESGNLLDTLGQIGMLPRQIRSLMLLASGHSFDVEVLDISLLAQE